MNSAYTEQISRVLSGINSEKHLLKQNLKQMTPEERIIYLSQTKAIKNYNHHTK